MSGDNNYFRLRFAVVLDLFLGNLNKSHIKQAFRKHPISCNGSFKRGITAAKIKSSIFLGIHISTRLFDLLKENRSQASIETIVILGLLLLAVIILALALISYLRKEVKAGTDIEQQTNQVTDPFLDDLNDYVNG